jgi:hypothetical protein
MRSLGSEACLVWASWRGEKIMIISPHMVVVACVICGIKQTARSAFDPQGDNGVVVTTGKASS